MEAHLSDEEKGSLSSNKRNGKGQKTVKGNHGEVTIATPQNRDSSFKQKKVVKRQLILADNLEKQIIAMYGMGNSLRDISEHIKGMYDTDISTQEISEITDRVAPKVREEGKVKHKALYNILGLNREGKKEVLGMYISESEGAYFWLQVLTHLQQRGLEDFLCACTNNLKGFSEAINSVFPKTDIQLCVIHQIRNSIKNISSKDSKEFMKDLKLEYRADTKALAESALLDLEEKWGKKYPVVLRSYSDIGERLSTYFDYSAPIRKIIYTTNAVEGFHRQIRKVIKNKGAFTSDTVLLKLVYLVTKMIEKKWTSPVQNWA